MAHYRRYCVRAGMNGRLIVDVPLGALQLRSEKDAVTTYAWLALMGKNELGEDVNKNSPTRKILMEEMFSRYKDHRGDVEEMFKKRIRFTAMCNVIT